MRIRLGTKESTLALLRAEELIALLRERGHEVETILLPNVGDHESIGQLRLGLLRDDFDVVIHRVNRIPLGQVPGVAFGAVPRRGDPRDVFVGHDGLTLSALSNGAKVATATPLRRAQMNRLRPGLELVDLKPDLTSALDQVARGELDGLVASAADMGFLQRLDEITDYLDTLPAPGQGALGYECRQFDTEMLRILEEFHDPDTRICVMAERAVAERLDLSPAAALGALASRQGVLELRAEVVPQDGSAPVFMRIGMPTSEFHATRCGHRLARALRERGVERIGRAPRRVEAAEPARRPTSLQEMRVLVAREDSTMAAGLREAGVQVDAVPVQRRELLTVSSTIDDADWVAFTSTRAVQSVKELGWTLPRGARIAAVGPGTADALRALGYSVDLVPDGASGVNALLDIWPDGTGTVIVPGSALLAPSFLTRLQRKGYTVHLIPVYTMQNLSSVPESLREAWRAEEYDAVIITSGSNAMAVGTLLGWRPGIPVIAVGESAIRVLQRAHVNVAKASDSYTPSHIAGLLEELLAADEG